MEKTVIKKWGNIALAAVVAIVAVAVFLSTEGKWKPNNQYSEPPNWIKKYAQ